MITLSINCGSSSVKFAVFGPKLQRLAGGLIEGTGAAALSELEAQLVPWKTKMTAIGHRVVHGGAHFSAPVLITPEVLGVIENLTPLAPEHQPRHIAGIVAATRWFPHCAQIACFDTSFHRTIPRLRQEMPLPPDFATQGLLRYGFHGLSCEYASGKFPRRKLAICHLGNGCSVTAVENGESQYTSMGFTPADGLMMGSRSGSLDPGAVLWLVEKLGSTTNVRALMNKDSGLKGVSGLSPDMRELLASHEPRAGFAISMFVDRLVLEIARAAASIQGLDALIFTGGIGENASPIRAQALHQLGWLGFIIDEDANRQNAGTVTTASSLRSSHVVRADEELMIAKSVAIVLARPGSAPVAQQDRAQVS